MKRIFLLIILVCGILPAGAVENVYFHVTDEYGYPLPDALITILDIQKAKTDVYGNAMLALARTFHTITVSKPGYDTHVTHFYVVGNHTIIVALKKSKISLLVTVKDIHGRPIPSVLVSAGNMADLAQNSTDMWGMTFLSFPRGAYIITAQKEGYEVAEKRGVIAESGTLTLYMNSKGMATVAGTVLLRGSPLPFVDIEVVPENGAFSYRGKTDAAGRFVVEVAKWGSYTVVIPKFGKVIPNVKPHTGLPSGFVVSVG